RDAARSALSYSNVRERGASVAAAIRSPDAPSRGRKGLLDAWTVRCAWGSGPLRGFGVRWRRDRRISRRLHGRSPLEQLPGGALGQVGRAGDEESERGGWREVHLKRR